MLNKGLGVFRSCDQIVKKYMFIFFQACERAESSKCCNLIRSGSRRYFTILLAKGPIVYYVVAGVGTVFQEA